MSKANLLHEFKSPINRIRGLSQILCSDDTLSSAERQAILKLIDASAERLTRSAESLILHTSWDGKHLQCDVVQITDLISRMEAVIADSQIFTANTISFQYAQDESAKFRMDVPLILQALDYLVNNACKFVHEGEVSVSLLREENQLIIEVSDDGPGMHKPGDATQPFWQESSGLSRLKNGLGLGLTITEKIAHAHGGSLELTSGPGAGLQAHLKLPILVS